jgi:hypothetical protein
VCVEDAGVQPWMCCCHAHLVSTATVLPVCLQVMPANYAPNASVIVRGAPTLSSRLKQHHKLQHPHTAWRALDAARPLLLRV